MSSERETGPIVVDDWPEPVAVSRAELDVIETWLGRLLDEILIPPGRQDRREPSPKPARPPSEGTGHE